MRFGSLASAMPFQAEKTSSSEDYESTPISRAEYIAAVVHLYRGELYRANSWRIRLDMTTNWAVFTTAGLLSFAFTDPRHSHWSLLVGLALISVFWGFEARRYRRADVWYSRVRRIEENFYGPILRRDPVSPEQEWGHLVADDLFRPRYKIGRMHALRSRLIGNYWALFLVLVLSWTVKVLVHPDVAQSTDVLKGRLGSGLLPWWLPLAYVGGFLLFTSGMAVFGPRTSVRETDLGYLDV